MIVVGILIAMLIVLAFMGWTGVGVTDSRDPRFSLRLGQSRRSHVNANPYALLRD
jgi:hypothetical protein